MQEASRAQNGHYIYLMLRDVHFDGGKSMLYSVQDNIYPSRVPGIFFHMDEFRIWWLELPDDHNTHRENVIIVRQREKMYY